MVWEKANGSIPPFNNGILILRKMALLFILRSFFCQFELNLLEGNTINNE